MKSNKVPAVNPRELMLARCFMAFSFCYRSLLASGGMSSCNLVCARVVFTSHKIYPSDLILAQLALANTIVLLTLEIPETVSAWGLKNFLDSVGCKILLYLYQVGRGFVISTTCLLSIFQAITISPSTSRWAEVKAKSPRNILPSCLFSWVLSLLIQVTTPIYLERPSNLTNIQMTFIIKYCSSNSPVTVTTLVNMVVFSLRDLFFVGLMSTASGYMVFVLHRHHPQVQHLSGSGCSPRVMPEVRAAKNVVTLVTLYVLLYGQGTVMLSILVNMRERSPHLVTHSKILSFTFSAISPFLIIHSNQRMRMFGRRTSPISNSDSTPASKEVICPGWMFHIDINREGKGEGVGCNNNKNNNCGVFKHLVYARIVLSTGVDTR
ncbi:vomeronasal 1 receptor ornAnaV1R3050 [Ornithorhynchus anatinus]|uniref:Vomeronasal type-1 receptor n=1 Tax=Ornithorhynchus anatinus TaxID=9258 RepID=F7AH45_ORNAN|nr:vomeronasal 1 receptor ornAnaV1R3050 [Ornithorhynchus anatinus]